MSGRAATCEEGPPGANFRDLDDGWARAGRGSALPRPAPAPDVPLARIISEQMFLSMEEMGWCVEWTSRRSSGRIW